MSPDIQDKKDAALQAALELISEQGFQGAPMSQIAQRANIGVGTIYRYFTNKDDLINALYLNIKTRISHYILHQYVADAPIREGFKQLLAAVVGYFLEHRAEMSFLEQYENSPLITAATHAESQRIAEPMLILFQRACEQQLMKDLPLEILGALLSGAVTSLVKLYLSQPAQLNPDSLSAALDAIWDLIKK